MNDKAIIVTAAWIGIYIIVLIVAGAALFHGCAGGACDTKRTIFIIAATATAPFVLGGLAVHLFVVMGLAERGNTPPTE